MKYTVDRLRDKALSLISENEALEFLICSSGRKGKKYADEQRNKLKSATKRQLQKYIDGIQRHLKDRKKENGVKASPSTLIKFLKEGQASPPDTALLSRINDVRSYFHDYSKVWTSSTLLPAHAWVIFDYHGCGPEGKPDYGYRILEASLYEDMAALWNLLHERAGDIGPSKTARQIKTHFSLCRGTLASSVYFFEAYLNGLAFDHLSNCGDTLTDKEKSVLSDWDLEKDRPCHLSVRDKALKFQQIILKKSHAPIQPNNNTSMKIMFNLAEKYRNALAHAGPHYVPNSQLPDKEIAIYEISIEVVKQGVDAAINVVQELEQLVQGSKERISWLHPRSPAGTFPNESFK